MASLRKVKTTETGKQTDRQKETDRQTEKTGRKKDGWLIGSILWLFASLVALFGCSGWFIL